MRQRRGDSDGGRPDWLLPEGGGDWSAQDRARYARLERRITLLLAAAAVFLILSFLWPIVGVGPWATTASSAAWVGCLTGAFAVRDQLPYAHRWLGQPRRKSRARAPRSMAFDLACLVVIVVVGVLFLRIDEPAYGALMLLAAVYVAFDISRGHRNGTYER